MSFLIDVFQIPAGFRSEEHTSELQSRFELVCRLLLEKKKVPEIGILCDVPLDPYPSHGNDGLLRDGFILNNETVCILLCFFFNDTATTEIYTLSLHDALPISLRRAHPQRRLRPSGGRRLAEVFQEDRKSTRLNSSHVSISYAVFCLKNKKNIHTHYNSDNQHRNKYYRLNPRKPI